MITSRHLVLSATPDSRGRGRGFDLTSFLDRSVPLPDIMAQVEKQLIIEGLRRADGLEIEAANLLGIDMEDLLAKMRLYAIQSEKRAE